MFTALQTLLATVAGITLSIMANDNGTLTVTLVPKPKKEGGEAALNTPLSLTGTPEELDAEFANIVTSYTSKRQSLAEQLEATTAILEAAQKDASKKATKAVTKGKGAAAGTSEKASTESKTDEGGDDNDDESGGSSTAGEDAASAPAEAKSDAASNLWD